MSTSLNLGLFLEYLWWHVRQRVERVALQAIADALQSSNGAWTYGVSGPFWYASGATIQVLLFGILAIEVKRRAPKAHTVCEMVKADVGLRQRHQRNSGVEVRLVGSVGRTDC